jgi:hypothetical protein
VTPGLTRTLQQARERVDDRLLAATVGVVDYGDDQVAVGGSQQRDERSKAIRKRRRLRTVGI